MNIFILDDDMQKCAEYHCDRHIVKMPIEYAQMLSTIVRKTGVDAGYKVTHANHPCTKWASESLSNWLWLRSLAQAINEEYRFRYGKKCNHASWDVASALPVPKIIDIGLTVFPQCMPDQYKTEFAVKAYRNYYVGDKQHIAKWSNRNVPDWFEITV